MIEVGETAIGWGKPLGYDRGASTAFHAVVAIKRHAEGSTNEHGAFVTACKGRWLTSEQYVYFAGISPCSHSSFPVFQLGALFFDRPCPECLRRVGASCETRRDHGAREPSTFVATGRVTA